MLKAIVVFVLLTGVAVGATVTLLDDQPVKEPQECGDRVCACPSDEDCSDCRPDADCKSDCKEHCDCPEGRDEMCAKDCADGACNECKKDNCHEVDCSEHPYERPCRDQVCENHPDSEDCAYMKWCNEFPEECKERKEVCSTNPDAQTCRSQPWCAYWPEHCAWEHREDGRKEAEAANHHFELPPTRVFELGITVVAPDTPIVNLAITVTGPAGVATTYEAVVHAEEENTVVIQYRAEEAPAGDWEITLDGVGTFGFIVHGIGLP